MGGDAFDQRCAELAERERKAADKERKRRNAAVYRKRKKAREQKRVEDLEQCRHENQQLKEGTQALLAENETLKEEVKRLKSTIKTMNQRQNEILLTHKKEYPAETDFGRFELVLQELGNSLPILPYP